MRNQLLLTVVGLVTAILCGNALAAGFLGLGDLPGGDFESKAYGVSADGSVVVCQGESTSGEEAFRWTLSGGIVGLGDLLGGTFSSRAYGVSADGAVVVGYSNSTEGGEAFRWTQSGGIVGLGDLLGGSFWSWGYGVSADGSAVVGFGNSTSGTEAYRWTQSGGMVGLGDLPGSSFDSFAYGVSADGAVVVGCAESTSGSEAFRWTQSGGMVSLGDLSGGTFLSRCYGVSADGSVAVGYSDTALGWEAFRWTQSGGMVGLGDLPGGSFSSSAYGVSGDGATVVGRSFSDVGADAFMWDAANGMRSVKDVLTTDFGLDLSGWDLPDARAASADGSFIVGLGTNPNGDTEAWIAYLSDTAYSRPDASGAWDSPANWPLTLPNANEHVVIAPGGYATVTGPSWATTVKSLTLGGGAGSATLRTSGGGDLAVTEAVTVKANGTLDHEVGTLSAGSLVNEGSVEVAGGRLVTVSGLLNRRYLRLSGGSIEGANVTNDYGAQAYAHGTIKAGLYNNGRLDLTGVLEFSGTVVNYGEISIGSGESLWQERGLDNYGTIELSGGAITGPGAVVNNPGGIIRGGSSIAAPLSNEGLIHADGNSTLLIQDLSGGNAASGELRIDDGAGINVVSGFSNSGTIVLDGADATLSGGGTTNYGTIRGRGRVSNAVNNRGAIRAEGGALTLAGALANDTDGMIRAPAGATVIVSQGLASNLGDIVLSGGAFDNNHQTMANNGSITGHGSFSSGELENRNYVGVGAGDMDFFGPVVNDSIVNVAAACTATFYDDVSGSGKFEGAGTVVFLGAVSPGSSPGQVDFSGDVVFGAGSQLNIELGGQKPGIDQDQVNVAGTASLTGTLAISSLGGFVPDVGDQFVIVTWGVRNGEFAQVAGGSLGGLALVRLYQPQQLLLHATYFGDANLDGKVDGADFTLWADSYRQPGGWGDGDFNDDDFVDGGDFTLWADNYRAGYPSAVPEPTALVLLALGAGAIRRRKREKAM